jgi:predicted NUDIX family NTP pyrophosphohydrolase
MLEASQLFEPRHRLTVWVRKTKPIPLTFRVGGARTSAGLLMFRKAKEGLEVLLVHPGGPFFRNKDQGVWTIPKGEVAEGEDLLTRARIEFEEELGISAPAASANWIELGSVKQKGGKTVHAWGFEGNLPDAFAIVSNTFEMEWPPRSGRIQQFPEIDRAEFFPIEKAREKINEAQVAFLDRLVEWFRTR